MVKNPFLINLLWVNAWFTKKGGMNAAPMGNLLKFFGWLVLAGRSFASTL